MGQLRVAKTKVRTGCRTCKKRRVKCDEGKPECRRCVSGGRQCEGYEVVAPRQVSYRAHRALLPGPRYDSVSSGRSSASLSPPLSSLPGISPDEAHYFEYFCKYTAPTISGPFASPLFERFVLQLGHREPLIRHAATALAALQIEQERRGRVTLSPEEAEFAFKQYGMSLALMATVLPPSSVESQRLALVACVLFVTFEIAQRRFTETAMHLAQGLNLLVHVRYRGHLPEAWDLGDFDTSDEGAGLDSELIQTFDRLDIQSSYYKLSRPKLPSNPAFAAKKTPTRFKSLDEARIFLNAITRSVSEFRNEARAVPSPFSAKDFLDLEESQAQIRWQLQVWYAAFSIWKLTYGPSLSDTPPPLNVFARACLEVVAVSSSILLETGIADGRECVYDSFLPDFERIVDLAELAETHRRRYSRSCSFYLHMGYVHAVYLVALKCRDPIVRRRAIELLDSIKCREGLWDGPMGGKIMRYVCELEESGYKTVLSAADLPEKARIHEALFDLTDRTGGVKTYYKRRDLDGEHGEPGAWLSWTDRARISLTAVDF